MSKLVSLSIKDCDYVDDADSKLKVYHVSDSHALSQAAGYLKFVHGNKDGLAIHFRGQTKLYEGLVPNLFRGFRNQSKQGEYTGLLNKYLKYIATEHKIFKEFDAVAVEPLMQHYGIKTSWIDLVDNVWVALWFACHQAKYTGDLGQYLHFERRKTSSTSKYAYILLIGIDAANTAPKKPGFYIGKETEFMDLRVAAPSIFLRPHSQHGVLFRSRGDGPVRPTNYKKHIKGVIRVDLDNALNWLGSGTLLNVHSLFPPPVYDFGYGMLVSSKTLGDSKVGSINYIGA